MEVQTKWRWLITAYVVAVLICAGYYISGENFTAASSKDKDPAPQVSVEKEVYDFGRVRQGVILHHGFRVRNTGQQELLLYRQGGIVQIRIAPGDVKEVKLTLHTARRAGRIRKFTLYKTNDPDRPEMRLTVTAVVLD